MRMSGKVVYRYCPARGTEVSRKPLTHNGFHRIVAGADLNSRWLCPTLRRAGPDHEHRQDAIRTAHGFPAMEHVRSNCRALRWQPRRADAVLRRTKQAMAFAQLTHRESLRDIEACLSAQSAKLYHMGFREPVRRSTLADANETRDWRIFVRPKGR